MFVRLWLLSRANANAPMAVAAGMGTFGTPKSPPCEVSIRVNGQVDRCLMEGSVYLPERHTLPASSPPNAKIDSSPFSLRYTMPAAREGP